MKKVLLLGFVAISLFAFGQGIAVPPQTALKTVNGITMPLANATITVCPANSTGLPCTPATVPLYKDLAFAQPLSNPFNADSNGNYTFVVNAATFSGKSVTVTVTGSGYSGYSYQLTIPLITASPGPTGFTFATTSGNFQATLAASNSGTVIVPSGTYTLIGPVGTWGVTIIGAGSQSTTLLAGTTFTSGDRYLLDAELKTDGSTSAPLGVPSNFNLSGVTIDCQGNGWSGLRGYTAQMSFYDVRIRNCFDGFTFVEPYMSSFHNLTATSNTNNGFVWTNDTGESMTSLDIQNIWANSNGADGIQIGPANDTTITNSFAQNSGVNNWNFIGAANGVTAAVSITCVSCDAEGTGVPFNLAHQRNIVFISPLVTSPPATVDFMVMNDVTSTIFNWNQPGLPGGGHFFINYTNNNSGINRPILVENSNITINDSTLISATYSSINASPYLSEIDELAFGGFGNGFPLIKRAFNGLQIRNGLDSADGTLEAFSYSINGGTPITGQTGTSANVVMDTGPTIGNPTITNATINTATINTATLPSPKITGSWCPTGSTACQAKRTTVCSTSTTQFSTCAVTVTWTSTLSDANYTASCQLDGTNVVGTVGNMGSKTATTMAVNIINMTSGTAITSGAVDCIAVHD